jgi:type VI secretion system protein ImpL
LLNAGLTFPLAAEMGEGAIAGVGGTRLCEWWFTDAAVLFDTAGRYTTHDSDATTDRAGWETFLGLLRHTRPRQPLNGVIVAFALNDIAQARQEECVAHARAVRSRIAELESCFGQPVPVYLVFTKADLISGFSEFFADLTREQGGQVWGMTFPLQATGGDLRQDFALEFGLLVERLRQRLPHRLLGENSPDRRGLIAGFPPQVANLEAPLAAFLTEAFGAGAGDRPPWLRGVYLTSATQEGTPFDRMTGAIARAFGLDQRRAPRPLARAGRSFFLADLLREVVFNEAMLVSARPAARRRRLLLRAGAFVSILLVAGAAIGFLLAERASGQRTIDVYAASLAEYERAASGQNLASVSDADLAALSPLLDKGRALASGVAQDPHTSVMATVGAWLGLSQEGKLGTGARALYRHALDRALLPRLLWRLETQMRGNLARPDFLYEATRIYLMLGNGGPLDPELVRQWMRLDWETIYPGSAYTPLRESLGLHLNALLAAPLPRIELDGELVAKARETFGRAPVAQRVYSRIRPSEAALSLPPWKPSDALGAAGVRVFVRASGRPLSDGVPGFFTVEGFHTVLLPSVRRAAQAVASESWVLGQPMDLRPDGPRMQSLERDVIALYESDYAQAWDALLADLDVAPLRSLPQAAQDLFILGSPQSPMRELLVSVSRQLALSTPPANRIGDRDTPHAERARPVTDQEARLQALFRLGPRSDAAVARPGHEIDDRYRALRETVNTDAGAQIDRVLKIVTSLQQQLAKLAASAGRSGSAPAPGDDPIVAMQAEAQRQPQPLARWLASMAGSGMALRGGGAR